MARRKKGRPVHGWLVFDKPAGMTSTQAVGLIRRLFDAQKAGHAGTLDPLATGILPIALGEATKTVSYAVDGEKAYRFTVRWGAQTTTDDSEGAVVSTSDRRPRRDEIEAALPRFIGHILQVPPQFSAIKVDGDRAYDLAREGEHVALEPRPVVIEDLRVTEMPDAETTVFEAECGRGTYVRAIARDLGIALGCYGHVIALRRTRVGPFTENEAITREQLEAAAQPEAFQDGKVVGGDLSALLLPVEAALADLIGIAVSASDASRLVRGQGVIVRGRDAPIVTGPFYATCRGRLVAIGEAEQGELRPTRVFNLGAELLAGHGVPLPLREPVRARSASITEFQRGAAYRAVPHADHRAVRHPLADPVRRPDVALRCPLCRRQRECGSIGFITARTFPDPGAFRAELQLCRELTAGRPFGVNLYLTPREPENAFLKGHVEILLEEGVRVVETSGLPPKDLLPRLRESGVKVMHKVSTVRHALAAERLGVDAVAVVGAECGGHPGLQMVGTMVQAPLAAGRVRVPVAIGGGIGHGSQIVAALAMGADAVVIGTRMLVASEINAHPAYKARLVAADEGSSRLVMQSFRNTYRVLDNEDARAVAALEAAGETDYERYRPYVTGMRQREAYRSGDLERGVLSMGQSVAFATAVEPVAAIVARLMAEAEAAAQRLAGLASRA